MVVQFTYDGHCLRDIEDVKMYGGDAYHIERAWFVLHRCDNSILLASGRGFPLKSH